MFGSDPKNPVDLLIIGGGINGAGIARDAAGRGLSVLLCEQGDLAARTSSACTKLIHGGLRYLEYYEFRLVREALIEREVLLRHRAAHHLAAALRAAACAGPAAGLAGPPRPVPLRPSGRPQDAARLRSSICARTPPGASLKQEFTPRVRPIPIAGSMMPPRGAERAGCGRTRRRRSAPAPASSPPAAARTAVARRRGGCRPAQRANGHARALVNAAGPWVGESSAARGRDAPKTVRLVKGSHIMVPRLYEGERLFLQNPDKRVVFVIPYEGDLTLIGTTDIPYEGDPAAVTIGEAEIALSLRQRLPLFRSTVTPDDIVRSFSGVRPLYDDSAKNASAVTRDYVLDVEAAPASPPLSVFGGKITTFRRLAEHALDELGFVMTGRWKSWTAVAPCPAATFRRRFRGLAKIRLPSSSFGASPGPSLRHPCDGILGEATCLADLGEDFGGGLTAAEVDYLVTQEWARTADSILWRRSKLGLHLPVGTERGLRISDGGQALLSREQKDAKSLC